MSHRKFSNNRYEEIKKEVLIMFQDAEYDSFPIDCFEIAKRLRYVIRRYSELEPDALIESLAISKDGYSRVEPDPNTGMYRYVIYYNDWTPNRGRQRWTIFHEIGHICLGHHDNPSGNEKTEDDEADFFAKYAMDPPPLVHAKHCQNPDDVCYVFSTSGEFSVYAFEYYRKWLYDGPPNLSVTELEILRQFHFDTAA